MESDSDSTQLWERRHADLVRWFTRHGNCNVPKAEGKLGRWVVRQRELHKKGKLEPSRKSQLDALGFVWNTNEAAWETRYALLCSYATANGHCCVPISDASLGMWVAKMRANRRRGKLPPHRVAKLDALGFVWNTAEADWMDKFEKLLAFREREGHACVPFNEGELGWWVNTQRQSKRKSKLSVHRERLLDQAGFIWNPQQFLAARRRDAATAKARAALFGSSALPRISAEHGTKRPATLAFLNDRAQEAPWPTTAEAFAAKRQKVPESPPAQKLLLRPSTESVGTNSTGLSRLTGQETSALAEIRGLDTPVTSRTLSWGHGPRHNSPLADSMSSRTDRGDVQSIASLLSPSPVSPHELQAHASAPFRNLHFSVPSGSAVSELPSFHSGRSTLACVAGPRRGASSYNFVLPPISSLKVLRNPSRI